MPEVHVVGEIEGAVGFPSPDLYCKWKIVTDEKYWEVLEGSSEGQTQTDFPQDGENTIWTHPIDIHFRASGLKGWPKFAFQVWHQDSFGRNELYGYGFCHMPSGPGSFDLEVLTWRPSGTLSEEVTGTPQLRNPDVVTSTEDRWRLRTVTMGKIFLKLNLIFRGFEKYKLGLS